MWPENALALYRKFQHRKATEVLENPRNNEINIRTDLLRVHSLFHITIANPVKCSSALLANQRREKGKVFDKPREVDLSVD